MIRLHKKSIFVATTILILFFLTYVADVHASSPVYVAGTSWGISNTPNLWACRITMPEDGVIYSLGVWSPSTLLADSFYRITLYNDTGSGAPSYLKANTNTIVGVAGQWNDFSLISNYSASSGAVFWIAANGNYSTGGKNYNITTTGTSGNCYYVTLAITAALPDPFGTGTSNTNSLQLRLSYYTTTDTAPPTFGSITSNTTVAGNGVRLNCTISDDVAVANYTFAWNNTGSWTNQSIVTVSGTPIQGYFDGTWNATIGNIVGVQVWAGDSSNNSAYSGITYFTLTASAWNQSFIGVPNGEINMIIGVPKTEISQVEGVS